MLKNHNDIVWTVLLWVLFLGILVSIFFYSYNREYDQDEIEHLHTGWKIVQGQKIYIDFFQHHHPFYDYIIAAVIRTYGETVDSIFASRYVMLLLTAGILAATYLISVRVFKSAEVGVLSMILTSTVITFYMKTIEIRPDVPQALAGLLSIYFLFSYYDKKSLKSLIASSVFLAVSFLFLQKSIVLIVAIGALLLFDLYKKRIGYRHAVIYAGTFLIAVSPYYIYLLLSGTFEQYIVMNWLVNYYIPQVFGKVHTLVAFSRENTITCVFYLIGLIILMRTGKCGRFAALSVLLMLLTVIVFNNLWRQYFLLSIPPIAIIASYALYSSSNSRLIRLVFLIGAIYFPVSYMHNFALFNMDGSRQRQQLAKIEYVLSITDKDDKVYDGNVEFNVFRDDIDFVWFCMEDPSCLDAYRQVEPYQYNVYDSVAARNPKVISDFGIYSFNDVRIRKKYKKSDRYPDLYIRVD
ncbi:MAG: glycosyltransferase family 39 protein [Thermodesulfobacteriota bacterium]